MYYTTELFTQANLKEAEVKLATCGTGLVSLITDSMTVIDPAKGIVKCHWPIVNCWLNIGNEIKITRFNNFIIKYNAVHNRHIICFTKCWTIICGE